eukprot:324297_1
MGTTPSLCVPFEDEQGPKSEKKEESGYELDKNKPRSVVLLDIIANKPAGFYSQAWFSRIGYKEFFDTQIADKGDTDATAKECVLNWTKCMARIAGADGLSEEENEVLIKSMSIWSGYTVTEKELETVIKEGVEMNTDEAANAGKMAANAAGGFDAYTSSIHILYWALFTAGVDGLSNEEKDTFKEIGKKMNIKQEDIDEILKVYLMEVEFGKRLNNLLGARDKPEM